MGYIVISALTFCLIFGAGLLGMLLRNFLPQDHLSDNSKAVVTLGMGLVGTMAALVLGLLIASAKGSYDAQSGALLQMSAKIISLDHTLARYGPEAKEPREAAPCGGCAHHRSAVAAANVANGPVNFHRRSVWQRFMTRSKDSRRKMIANDCFGLTG